MEYEAKDFEKMMFDPYEIHKSVNLLEAFPQLDLYPEFKVKIKSLNNIIRYICYVYDKNSPLRIKEEDILKRKLVALKLAHFKMNDNNIWAPQVEKMLLGLDPKIRDMTMRFLRLHRSPKFSLLIAMEESYYNILSKMTFGNTTLPKGTHDLVLKLVDDIENLAINITNEDNSIVLKEALYSFIEYEKLNILPEDIATLRVMDKLKNKEEMIKKKRGKYKKKKKKNIKEKNKDIIANQGNTNGGE